MNPEGLTAELRWIQVGQIVGFLDWEFPGSVCQVHVGGKSCEMVDWVEGEQWEL